VVELPQKYFNLNNNNAKRSRTFASSDHAFSLSNTEQSLSFHYDSFRMDVEIVNHDCIDFVFYQDKVSNVIKVLSFIEQNDQYSLQLDAILPLEKKKDLLSHM